MNKVKSRHRIKIPLHISVLYCEKKRIVVVKRLLERKSLKLKVKLALINEESVLEISSKILTKMSRSQTQKIEANRGTVAALIKQMIVEVSSLFYQKLRLDGVGYRVFKAEKSKGQLLLFKLGYSHFIYFKVPQELHFFCFRSTKLFVFGDSYQKVTQTTSTIRSNKTPEPYKGKGILYENEKILLKEGKKV